MGEEAGVEVGSDGKRGHAWMSSSVRASRLAVLRAAFTGNMCIICDRGRCEAWCGLTHYHRQSQVQHQGVRKGNTSAANPTARERFDMLGRFKQES